MVHSIFALRSSGKPCKPRARVSNRSWCASSCVQVKARARSQRRGRTPCAARSFASKWPPGHQPLCGRYRIGMDDLICHAHAHVDDLFKCQEKDIHIIGYVVVNMTDKNCRCPAPVCCRADRLGPACTQSWPEAPLMPPSLTAHRHRAAPKQAMWRHNSVMQHPSKSCQSPTGRWWR